MDFTYFEVNNKLSKARCCKLVLIVQNYIDRLKKMVTIYQIYNDLLFKALLSVCDGTLKQISKILNENDSFERKKKRRKVKSLYFLALE